MLHDKEKLDQERSNRTFPFGCESFRRHQDGIDHVEKVRWSAQVSRE